MREKKEINIQIGEQIHFAREQAKLTQEELAERIEVSPQYISDAERGVVGVSLTTLKKICLTLGVSSDQILFGTTVMDKGRTLSSMCQTLSDEQFSLLTDIVKSFVKAVHS